jgi:hypothetical protein
VERVALPLERVAAERELREEASVHNGINSKTMSCFVSR